MDGENASFDKNFTIQAIRPNKDDDNDSLTYAQEQALGTVTPTPIPTGTGLPTGRKANGSSQPIRTQPITHRCIEPFKTSVLEKLAIGIYLEASSPATRIWNNLTSVWFRVRSDRVLFSIDANDSPAVELDQNKTQPIR